MPISDELGIISNLGAFVCQSGALLRDPNKGQGSADTRLVPAGRRVARRHTVLRGPDDICHHQLMMISTGAVRSIPR